MYKNIRMMDLIEEAVKATMEYLHIENEDWLNKGPNYSSRLVRPDDTLKREIDLFDGETPILEFDSENAYSLITTERIISIINGVFCDGRFENLRIVRPLITEAHMKAELPRDTLIVVLENKEEFLAIFDVGKPVYFAKMLATNLIWKKKTGKFYLDRYDS